MNTSETASPTHTELHQRAAELTALLEVTRQLAATRNLQDLLSLAAQQIVTVTGVRGCALLRRDEDGATVTVWVEHRRLFPEQAAPAGTRYALTDFPAARRVLETGEPVVLSADDPRTHLAEADYMRHRRASDMLLLPLPVRGRRIGLVMMDDANRQKFTDVEIRLCQIVVEQVAIAIENARLYEETDRLRAFNQNIVQSLGEGIVVEDESGIITFANPTAAEMLNYQPKEMVGLHWRNIVAPEAIPRVEKESAKRPHGRASRYETICITRTGARVPVIVSARPLFQGEHFTGVLAVFRDITDRKRDEEVLQQRNRQLELLYRAGQVFMSTLNLDEVLATVLEEVRRLLDVVACSVWLVDRKTGELVCRQVTNPQGDVVRGWRLPPGKGLAGWVAQHGQTLNVPDVQHEPRHFKGVDEKTGLSLRSILTVPLRAKGETIGVIQVVDATVSRFNRDDQMLVESLAAAAARAIENARLYTALKESQEYARNIIDSSLDIIITVDKDRRIVEFNRAAEQAFGYRREEVVGRHVDMLYADREESRRVHEVTIQQGRYVEEVLNRRKNGQTFPTFLSASVLRDADGNLLGVMGVSRDITDYKKAQSAEREQRLLAETLREVTLALASQTTPEAVLDEVLRQAQRLVPYTTAHIVLLKKGVLQIACQRGYEAFHVEEVMKSIAQPLSEYPLDAEILQSQKPLVVSDTRREPRWRVMPQTEWVRSHIAVPLCHRGRALGLLRLDSEVAGRFTTADAERLRPLANAAAVALEKARLYEQAIQDAQTKLTLLNEVNHRVKNNLTAIIGLLYAEQQHAAQTNKPCYSESMNSLISRVQGLVTVHNLLSASEWQPLDLSNLTRQVIHSALQALPPDRKATVTVSASSVRVTPKQANNLAMVINELATNAVKHAPPAAHHPLQITVDIRQQGETVRIEFRDNGPGYPPALLENLAAHSNVGFDLIHNIVQKSLRGSLLLGNDDGAVTVIQFPLEV